MKRRTAAALMTVLVAAVATPPAAAGSEHPLTQTAPLNWHAQSGNEGAVGDGAEATLQRSATEISYEITTHSLKPGNAYTVWLVVVNDPAACTDSPCAPPQFFSDPAPDAQVTFGLDGQVANDAGAATFTAEIAAGPLLNGWLPVQGLDDPVGAEIHLVLNDHGPVIDEMADDMLSTYRGGCADDSPFPEIFPETAIADGAPGPNTCQLYQSVVFLPPARPVSSTARPPTTTTATTRPPATAATTATTTTATTTTTTATTTVPPTTTTPTTEQPPSTQVDPITQAPSVQVTGGEASSSASWSAVAGADYYEIDWNESAAWSRVDGTAATGPGWQHLTNCERSILVAVRAVNEHGPGPEDAASDFTVVQPPSGQQCQ